MTLNCCKVEFSRNFAWFRMFGRQQQLNHPFNLCQAIHKHDKLTQCCRVFILVLARLSCITGRCATVQCAKRGIAITFRLSVCPSVYDVGGLWPHRLGWKSLKLIARTISPTSSLFIAQRSSTYPPILREHGEILGRLEVGCTVQGKVACWSTKAAISLKRHVLANKKA